jgi:hypothetical protein
MCRGLRLAPTATRTTVLQARGAGVPRRGIGRLACSPHTAPWKARIKRWNLALDKAFRGLCEGWGMSSDLEGRLVRLEDQEAIRELAVHYCTGWMAPKGGCWVNYSPRTVPWTSAGSAYSAGVTRSCNS